jgi:hypothetical protein
MRGIASGGLLALSEHDFLVPCDQRMRFSAGTRKPPEVRVVCGAPLAARAVAGAAIQIACMPVVSGRNDRGQGPRK